MSPRPRSVSDAEVLEATGRAIARVGPNGLTLAEVAREAGIAPPTLIQRFGSKRGLLLAFAEQGPEGVRETFAAARAESDSPLRALREALVRMTASVRTREAMANHLAVLQMDLADPDFHRHALAHGELLRREVAATLEEAARRGEIEGGEDVARLARAVQALFNGALLTWAVHDEGTVEEAVREALEVLLARRASADGA